MRNGGWLALAALVAIGCGDKGGGSDGGGGAGGGGGGSGAGDMATALTDAQRCDTACAKLIACGVQYDANCSAGCQASTVFMPCLRTTALDDCNALATCVFKEYSHDSCGDSGGVPSGSATCNDTATCEGNCNVSGPQPACSCNCVTAAAPSKAIGLLINNQCAIALCSTECATSGTACNNCFNMKCTTQHEQCVGQ